ncbi:cardiolipin synthase [Thermanaerosceptrum fracticalcis]|nr:cardiolipin synthase [Thermanaerosceptrum fracticalcis]
MQRFKPLKFIIIFLFILLLFVTEVYLINRIDPASVPSLARYIPFPGMWEVTLNIFSVIFASLVVFTAVVIFLERRDPAKTVAWLLILIFLPVMGFILYLTIGRQFRKRRMVRKKAALNNYIYPLDESFSEHESGLPHLTRSKERLIRLILSNANFPITLNNSLRVLTDGQEIFPAFMEAIKEAKKHIHLETYILRDDQIGNEIKDLLIAKAKEGVKVRIIYDGLGSRKLGKKYLQELNQAGIETEPFFPVKLPFLHSKINYRNHRKILVVDGTTAFVGGINIGDEYLGRDPKIGYWRDTHLELRGNAVYFLQRIFLQDWYFVTRQALEEEFSGLFPVKEPCGNKVVQITASGPDTEWEAIMQVFYYAMATAEKSLYVTSPYFVPNESILTALKTAALSGVDVKLILPAKPDHKIVFWASMSYMEELLETGVEVYLYHKGFIHAKTMMIDGIVSTVGSANMDQRSFELNFEVNAFIYDEETTQRLEKDFFEDLKHCQQIDLETFKERPLTNRFLESGARLLSPLL